MSARKIYISLFCYYFQTLEKDICNLKTYNSSILELQQKYFATLQTNWRGQGMRVCCSTTSCCRPSWPCSPSFSASPPASSSSSSRGSGRPCLSIGTTSTNRWHWDLTLILIRVQGLIMEICNFDFYYHPCRVLTIFAELFWQEFEFLKCQVI